MNPCNPCNPRLFRLFGFAILSVSAIEDEAGCSNDGVWQEHHHEDAVSKTAREDFTFR
jgi:hypothetical protein